MLFKFLLAIAGTHSLGLRREAANGRVLSSAAASVDRLGDLVASAARASTSESLESLSQASDILGSMMTAGNATEHMSDEDAVLLKSVISMIEENIYGSMDSSHQVDKDALRSALDAIAKCNSDIVVRLAPDGDLDMLYQGTLEFQSTLNDKQTDVEAKTEINNTKFDDLERHISTIQEAPACSSFPAKPTKAKTDVFFDGSEYVNWYEAQKEAYTPIAEAFEASDTDLENAFTAYAVAKAERDVSYCDWKVELTNGCSAFDACYTEKLAEYQMDATPRVQQDVQFRIDAYKAGELIISQIRFLLGESTSAPPTDDASRYELMFPDAAPQEECSLAPLDADSWVPKPECRHQASGEVECEGVTNDMQKCPSITDWHSTMTPVKAWKMCIPVLASTGSGSCKEWCEARDYECLRAQDNKGGCNLDTRHERKSTADNGCNQGWGDQVCQCGNKMT